jgi:hypothetical protein
MSALGIPFVGLGVSSVAPSAVCPRSHRCLTPHCRALGVSRWRSFLHRDHVGEDSPFFVFIETISLVELPGVLRQCFTPVRAAH